VLRGQSDHKAHKDPQALKGQPDHLAQFPPTSDSVPMASVRTIGPRRVLVLPAVTSSQLSLANADASQRNLRATDIVVDRPVSSGAPPKPKTGYLIA
jgi:hypothetical protein